MAGSDNWSETACAVVRGERYVTVDNNGTWGDRPAVEKCGNLGIALGRVNVSCGRATQPLNLFRYRGACRWGRRSETLGTALLPEGCESLVEVHHHSFRVRRAKTVSVACFGA